MLCWGGDTGETWTATRSIYWPLIGQYSSRDLILSSHWSGLLCDAGSVPAPALQWPRGLDSGDGASGLRPAESKSFDT